MGEELAYLTPEARARVEIDRKLTDAGWAVQDAARVNLTAARGVAVREFVMKRPHGRADYLLFVDGAAAGVIEAKKEGETLTGVEWQSAKYVDGLPNEIPTAIEGALPFAYESTGAETRFTNALDVEPASREVFSFHRPETLAGWLADIAKHPTAPTLRHRLRALPPLAETGLWPAQVTAIRNLEESLAANRPRALIQMATGSGKTFTAANVAYRLVKHADAARVLFLVDRANLGRQTLREFQSFSTPDQNGLVQRLWSYCNVLRDDGLSYGDYLEQLTYLLFLKMADEQTKPPFSRPAVVPDGLDWPSLLARDGDELEVHYRHVITELGRKPGMLGVVFRKAQNRIQDPAKLRRLVVDLIDRESWLTLDADVKGDAYEGLLEKNAEDVKSGAGQYFTPRALIKAIVEVMRPQPETRICDPACGTGGFLLAAHESIARSHLLDPDQKHHLRYDALRGWEIVDNTARLCVMNLLLHGIGDEEHESPIAVDDALKADPGERFDMVLTNPPFGRKSSMTFVSDEGEVGREDLVVVRDDFWASTSNKQLNFVQHVRTLLAIEGRAAVVVPDNVLFEGGAGETVRRRLLHECEVHTLLRLPPGIWYAPGVKANVLFFDRKPASETPWTRELWVYDLRTNQHFTLKQNPLRYEHLQDFINAYNPENRRERVESERFRRFAYDDLIQRDKVSLDLVWLRDESLEDMENLPPPDVIAAEIVLDLEAALAEFAAVAASLSPPPDDASTTR